MIRETLLAVISKQHFMSSRQVAMLLRQQRPDVWEYFKCLRQEEKHHSTLSAMAHELKKLSQEGLVINERLWEPSMNKNYINIWKKYEQY